MMIRKALPFTLVALTVTSSIFVSEASGQNKFKFARVTSTGAPAPVPHRLASASSPSINNQGEVAFEGDSTAVFLKSADEDETTIVVAPGHPAPGGGTFISATQPALNSRGQLVFVGVVTAPSRSGLFLFSNNKTSLLVAEGTPAPGGDIDSPSSPSINPAGDVAFLTQADTGTHFLGRGTGVFLISEGTITKLAVQGDPSPDGDVFSSFSFLSINQSKQVLFTAFLSSGAEGIYLASGGTITKIVKENDPSPFGGNFRLHLFSSASLNDAGQVAFSASVGGLGPTGIFLFSGGQITILVQERTQLPGGGTLAFTQNPSLNSFGQVAFQGFISAAGNVQILVGIFVTSGSKVIEVMRPGQSSPDGGIFSEGLGPRLNDAGQVAFAALLAESNFGVYLFNGQLARVGGQGDPIEHRPEFLFPVPVAINREGQTLVFDQTFPGDLGLFTGSADKDEDATHLIVHRGDPAPGGGVANDFNFLNNSSMNDSGQVTFDAFLSDLAEELLLKSGHTLTKIARDGDLAPNGDTFFSFDAPSINNQGEVAFPGFTCCLSFSAGGMFLFSKGEITELFSAEAVLPDGGQIGCPFLPSLNDQGQIAFFGEICAFPFFGSNGIYLFSNGAFTPIARDGDPTPGGGTFGLPFADFLFGPSLNSQGDVAFAADLSAGGTGVFLFSHGTLIKIATPGDPAPGGSTFLTADSPSINAAGEIAFEATTVAEGFGAFLYTSGRIIKVAGLGTRVRGHRTLTSAFSASVNAEGQVAFGGTLSDGTSATFVATPKPHEEADWQDAEVVSQGSVTSSTQLTPQFVRRIRPGHVDPRNPMSRHRRQNHF